MKKIKAIKKWWKTNKSKPITWGSYAKMCKWSLGITGLIYLAFFIWYKITEHKEKKRNSKKDKNYRSYYSNSSDEK